MNKDWLINTGSHITEEQIALYIESALMPGERAEVSAHLQECGRCQEIMLDAARLSGLWMAERDAFSHPQPVIEMRPPGRTWWHKAAFSGGNRSLRMAAAAAAVVLIAVVGFYSFDSSRGIGVSQEVIRPLQGALETASSIGRTVLPGGETGLAGRTSKYRSGTNGVLNQSIDKLEQRRESDPSNRDVSYWLAAAYVATGQTDLARDFTREARTRFTDDTDIATLYALVLFRDGDLAGAERELRRALGLEPDNAVAALNLGIILLESGQAAEAAALLTTVADEHADEPIGERARSILSATPTE